MEQLVDRKKQASKFKALEIPPFPKEIFLDLTSFCNHACVFCSNPLIKNNNSSRFNINNNNDDDINNKSSRRRNKTVEECTMKPSTAKTHPREHRPIRLTAMLFWMVLVFFYVATRLHSPCPKTHNQFLGACAVNLGCVRVMHLVRAEGCLSETERRNSW